jgi:hypothetical protein
MVWETTGTSWQLVMPVLVVVVCLLRLLHFIRRRRDPHYQGWLPTEIVAVRSLVVVITGKPVTPLTWKRIDVLLLAVLVLTVAASAYNHHPDLGHQSRLRRIFINRSSARP